MKIAILIMTGVLLSCCSHNKSEKSETYLSKLRFSLDHVVNKGETDPEFFKLQDLGFTLFDRFVDHPGPVRCRFINLNSGINGVRRFIEFCHITDKEKFMANLAAEGKVYPDAIAPSVAVQINGQLERYYNAIEPNFRDNDIKFQHRNYNWKEDNVSRLPGWNHVWFDKPLSKNFPIFMSEREPTEKWLKKKTSFYRKKRSPFLTHKNSVNGLIGIVLADMESQKLESFLHSERKDNRISLHDGSYFWFEAGARPELRTLLQKKKFPIKAVVLSADSLETFRKIAKPDHETDFFGEDAALIKLPDSMWDIIVVER